MTKGFFVSDGACMPTLDKDTLTRMRGEILNTFSDGEVVLGSKLGNELRPFIRPLKFPDVGGLRQFVSDHLPDVLNWIGRNKAGIEGDDVYKVVKQASLGWRDISELSPERLWSTYSNPSVVARFALPESRDSLLHCAEPDVPLPHGAQEIRKLTEEDYRTVAKEFIRTIPLPLQPDALQIASTPSFNSPWVGFLRNKCGYDTLRRWETTRVNWVFERFRDTLTEAGCTPEVCEEFVTLLTNARSAFAQLTVSKRAYPDIAQMQRHPVRTPQFAARSNPTNPLTDRPSDGENPEDVRKLIHQAIDHMALAELRELRLPVGILLDLLRSR
jgi:hypothetical protein